MQTSRKLFWLANLFVAGTFAAGTASATPYILHLQQQGSDVVATGNGEINLAGATYVGGGSTARFMYPSIGFLSTGGAWDFFNGITGPTSFGSGTVDSLSSNSGTLVGISGFNGFFYVPSGYASGTNLSGTATWNNATFSSLGVTPGIYRWTWGKAADQSFTLEIGNVSVPEPSVLALFGGGLLLLGAFLGLRRRGV